MGFFKKLAEVFVDFDDDKTGEKKEEAFKTLEEIKTDKISYKNKEKSKKIDSSDKREIFFELDEIFEKKGFSGDSSENTIYKVFEILQSPQLQGLDPAIVKTAVILNLEMNKIPIADLIKDGEKRIEVLDEYEKEKEKDILELEKELNNKNKEIEIEINNFLEQKKKEIESNKEKLLYIKAKLEEWKKVKEEEKEGLINLIKYLSKK